MARSSNTQKQMEMEDGVKLLSFWSSGYGIRAELALTAKGIKFQTLQEDLSNKSELLLTSNPVYKKVPVLIHNGRAICESRIIVEYIDETWPAAPRLLPDDPYDRYLVRFWSDFLDIKTKEILDELFSVRSAEEFKKVQEKYYEMGMILESGVEELEKRGCLYDGRSLKYIDVVFAASVTWFRPLQELLGLRFGDSEKCPRLHKWIQDLLANDVVKSTLPDSDKLLEFAKKRLGLLLVWID